jgi:hypothetical protein
MGLGSTRGRLAMSFSLLLHGLLARAQQLLHCLHVAAQNLLHCLHVAAQQLLRCLGVAPHRAPALKLLTHGGSEWASMVSGTHPKKCSGPFWPNLAGLGEVWAPAFDQGQTVGCWLREAVSCCHNVAC